MEIFNEFMYRLTGVFKLLQMRETFFKFFFLIKVFLFLMIAVILEYLQKIMNKNTRRLQTFIKAGNDK